MKYIHIGFPRTGTTWLQEVVFPEWMSDNDVAYFYLRFLDFDKEPKEKILLSSEAFTSRTILYSGDVKRSMQNMVNLFGMDIKVIITIRRISTWIESLYSDHILNGNTDRKLSWVEIFSKITQIHDFLKDHEIPFIEIWTDTGFDYHSLARFMDIELPTIEQTIRWNVRVNKRRAKWVIGIIKILNRYNLNRLRKILIRLT